MNPITIRLVAVTLTALTLAACANTPPVGPSGQPSSSDVNPITGSRGGTGSGGGGGSAGGAGSGGSSGNSR